MKILILYHFIKKDDFSKTDSYFKKLPLKFQNEIQEYKDENERNLRVISKLMFAECLRFFYPNQEIFEKQFKKDKNNQISLEHFPIHFSVSHSEKLCICCATLESEVGIDAEKITKPPFEIMEEFFHRNEIDLIEKKADNRRLFYKIWTKKEAILKADKSGIYGNFKAIDTTKNEVIYNSKKYFLHEILDIEDYIIHFTTTDPVIELIKKPLNF